MCKTTGREREQDKAEEWLKENDPEYDEQCKKWQTPSTDAIARDNAVHPTLKGLTPSGDGNYRRRSERCDDE